MRLNKDLFEEFNDNGGGSGQNAAQTLYQDDGGFNDYEAGTSDTPPGGQQQVQDRQTQVATPPAGVDYEKLAQTISTTLGKTLAPVINPAKPAPEMTVDQFRQLTKYYQVKPEDVKDLFGDLGEDQTEYARRAAVLQRLIDGQSQHSVTVAREMMQMLVNDRTRPYEQMRQQQIEQVKNTWVDGVCKKYKGLENAQPLVKLAIDTLRDKGYQSNNNEEEDTNAIMAIVKSFMSAAGNTNFQFQQAGKTAGARTGRGNMPGAVNGAGGSGHSTGEGDRQPAWKAVYSAAKR